MVNLVQTAVKTSGIELLSVKSQVSTSEESHSPSFGEILQVNRRKEQQALESKAAQAAAAQAALQQSNPLESPAAKAESHSAGDSAAAGSVSEVRSSSASADISKVNSSMMNDSDSAKTEVQAAKTTSTASDVQSSLNPDTSSSETGSTHVTSSLSGGVIHENGGDVIMFSEQLLQADEVQKQAVQASSTVNGTDNNSAENDAAVQADAAAAEKASLQPAGTVTSSLSQEKIVSAGSAINRNAVNKLASTGKDDQQVKEANGNGLPAQKAASGMNDQGAVQVEPVSTMESVRTSTENLRSFFSSQDTRKNGQTGTKIDSAQTIQFQNPVPGFTAQSAVSKAAASTISSLDSSALSLDIVQQVMQQMSATLKSGPASMHLQLNPRELGAIDVQMVKSSQGMSVTFAAEHASTGRLLETQIGQLRQSLTESGVKLSELNITQQGLSGQQGNSFRQQNPFEKQPAWRDVLVSQPAVNPTEIKTEQVSRQLQGVDYHV